MMMMLAIALAVNHPRADDQADDDHRPRFPSAFFYAKRKNMKRSISAKRKKRGRPATGIRPMIGLRLSDDETARLDRWARENGYTRSAAIRTLIERGLAKPKG